MTETRAPYTTDTKPTIVYPGSRLETLVEALDSLAEFAPEAYTLQLAHIHAELTEALHDKRNAAPILMQLLAPVATRTNE